MIYPSPPPSPPLYANFLPPVSSMDNLFDLRHGVKWLLKNFCNALHRAQPNSSQFGIASIQHRKRLYNNFQHEFVVLDVVPLIPGTSTPQPDGSHTYIAVGRVSDETRMSLFGIWGFAFDEVIVLRDDEASVVEKEYSSQDAQSLAGEHLATLSWRGEIPNILDVFSLITLLSLTFPYYNIFTHQRFWLARAIYDTLRIGYNPSFEDTGEKFWKRAKFYILIRVVTPNPPPAIMKFCDRQRVWRELANL